MSDINKAAVSVKGLVKQYRAVLAVGEALGNIADLEAATASANSTASKARSEMEEAVARRKAALQDLRETKIALEVVSKQKVDTAREQADEIVLLAKNKASKLIAKAEEEIKVSRDTFEAEADKHRSCLGGLQMEELELIDKIEAAEEKWAEFVAKAK